MTHLCWFRFFKYYCGCPDWNHSPRFYQECEFRAVAGFELGPSAFASNVQATPLSPSKKRGHSVCSGFSYKTKVQKEDSLICSLSMCTSWCIMSTWPKSIVYWFLRCLVRSGSRWSESSWTVGVKGATVWVRGKFKHIRNCEVWWIWLQPDLYMYKAGPLHLFTLPTSGCPTHSHL